MFLRNVEIQKIILGSDLMCAWHEDDGDDGDCGMFSNNTAALEKKSQ